MKIVRVAKVLIIDPDNQVLVLRIGDYKARPERSHTADLPGGLVDPGESERDAAVREAKEESAIILDSTNVILAYAQTEQNLEKDESITKMLYVTRIDYRPEVITSWEHEAFEWCDLATVTQTHEFRPFYNQAIQHVLDNQLIDDYEKAL